MARLTRKQKEIYAKHDFAKKYSLEQGVQLLKDSNRTTTFVPPVDIAVRLGADPTKADQMVRGTVTLPHGNGKEVKVLVICAPEHEKEAKEAGADFVGQQEFISKIEEGWLGFDVMVTQPEMMPKIAKIAKKIGPRGLMPSHKSGTVTPHVGQAVKEIKSGKISFKVDKYGIIHASIGRVSFSPQKIQDNAEEIIREVQRLKPNTVKGTYMRSIALSTTMGPGIHIDLQNIQA